MKLSVTPITKHIVEEISKQYCLIGACGMFNRPRKTVTEMPIISGQMTLVPICPC